ncbi:MAG: SpoVA/SpoVAEb family sporulation membrane protein, partial [Oscillospiraceae bacterium]|nr:SpoVA/SpoVAEb family sporulation membrane protein [Oscillospiraceae bacterium]
MGISKQQYDIMVKKMSPNSKSRTDTLKAFLIGGLICTIGQGFLSLYSNFGFDEKTAAAWTSITLVFLSALF